VAFTLEKNATKPNPFDIISLQTTRKETIGRPKKRWRERLKLWRWNGSKGSIPDVYDDVDEYTLLMISIHYVSFPSIL
jgi:hypothetical protein